MARLRHIAITVPDPERTAEFYQRAQERYAGKLGASHVGVHHFGFVVEDLASARAAIEAAGGEHWMGEPAEGGGFYEVKYFDPEGIAFDITAHGWAGARKT